VNSKALIQRLTKNGENTMLFNKYNRRTYLVAVLFGNFGPGAKLKPQNFKNYRRVGESGAI
jgi:hypothetical protein